MLLMPLFIVFLMCMVDLTKTKLLFRSLFSNTYFYKYPYDSVGRFSLYQILNILFISVVFSFLLMVIYFNDEYVYESFLLSFNNMLIPSLIYFFLKYLISEFLYSSSNNKPWFKQMLILETSYLTVVLLLVFFVVSYLFLHLNNYENVKNYLFGFFFFMYFIRGVILVMNNKNLLSGKILYIILYLCSLEIVPFIYLFKSYIE